MLFLASGGIKRSERGKCTKCLDLPFSPFVPRLLSSCDLSLLSGVSVIDPREKCLPRVIVSLLYFHLLSSSNLRLVIIE